MAKFTKYFTIDDESKTFLFGPRYFQDLFVEKSPVQKAFKPAMALGCYDDYKPAMRPMKINPKRNTSTQQFTKDGVVVWLHDNNPEWLAKWDASDEVRTPDNKKYSFMIRKNYFLFENPAARVYCGMDKDREYKLNASAVALRAAVEARLAAKAKEKK